jgi:hypothetical protein
LALPWIHGFGIEEGPALLNEFCGLLTTALVGFLVLRWTADCWAAIMAVLLFALNPVAAGWYRSGAAEPSAVMFALASLAAADLSRDRPGWVIASVITALAAVNIRLDNIALAVPLIVWLSARSIKLTIRHVLILLALAVPLIAALASLSSILSLHYLTARHESQFSFNSIMPNLASNFRFLLNARLLPFACAGFACLAWLARQEKKWLALLGWLGAQAALLSVYSVGQYSAPGGTRFFLIPSLVFTIGLAVALGKLPPRFRSWALTAGLLACCLSFPGREKIKQCDALNRAPQTEHDAILRWAHDLPAGAVVMSDEPYLWEAAGVFTAPHQPDIFARTSGPLYWHRSLFDRGQPLPPASVIVSDVPTPYGNVSLVRIQ